MKNALKSSLLDFEKRATAVQSWNEAALGDDEALHSREIPGITTQFDINLNILIKVFIFLFKYICILPLWGKLIFY